MQDCDREAWSNTGKKQLCYTHYRHERAGRLGTFEDRRTAGPGANKAEIVEYRAAHLRVEKARGKAATHFCVDCGQAADHWSLEHDATETIMSQANSSYGKVFSLDIYSYAARCIRCHWDLDGIKPPVHGHNQYHKASS